MVFGLTNAPSTFQRMTDLLLSGMVGVDCLVYIDDIIIMSSDFDEHMATLQSILERLETANLKVRLSKCHFCLPKISYLGHVVSAEGIQTSDRTVKAILAIEPPKTTPQAQSFMGMCNYYRRFINRFDEMSSPITATWSGENQFQFRWTDEAQKAFEDLKKAITQCPVLAYPDWNKDWIMCTDASGMGIGAVLEHSVGV